MDSLSNQLCPRCGRGDLNVYYTTDTDEKLGAWCHNCDLRAYFDGHDLVPMRQYA